TNLEHTEILFLVLTATGVAVVVTQSFFWHRAITLENQLVILGVSETDAGGYYVQAVNEKNGENKTSPFIHLSVAPWTLQTGVMEMLPEVDLTVFDLMWTKHSHSDNEYSWVEGRDRLLGVVGFSCWVGWSSTGTPSGAPLETRRGARLKGGGASSPSDGAVPAVVIRPHNASVVAGSSQATLECVANARPLERLSVTWKRNGIKITSGISSFGRRLTITNPTSADVGMYFCEAKLRESTEEPARAKAFLSILEPPYFTAEPQNVILAEVEKDVDILCQAMGVPMPTLVWYKDSVPLGRLENPRYKVLLSGGLRIHAPRPQDAGIFQCFASNPAGEIHTYTYLDVTNIKPAFIQPPEDTTVTEGMTAVLTCEVSGAPRPAISWKKGEQILASGSVQIPRFVLLESGGLQIAPVFLQDAGNYTCCAANSEGALNAFVMLTVWNHTSIVRPPEDSTVIKGTTATLRCEATHDPRISIRYLWKKDSVVINPSSSSRITVEEDGTLLISQTWSGDIGDYTCEVVSSGGNDSRTARLEYFSIKHWSEYLLPGWALHSCILFIHNFSGKKNYVLLSLFLWIFKNKNKKKCLKCHSALEKDYKNVITWFHIFYFCHSTGVKCTCILFLSLKATAVGMVHVWSRSNEKEKKKHSSALLPECILLLVGIQEQKTIQNILQLHSHARCSLRWFLNGGQKITVKTEKNVKACTLKQSYKYVLNTSAAGRFSNAE
ncbi:hypothetical protein DV515_00007838, partial [Chloebia gouldiae]